MTMDNWDDSIEFAGRILNQRNQLSDQAVEEWLEDKQHCEILDELAKIKRCLQSDCYDELKEEEWKRIVKKTGRKQYRIHRIWAVGKYVASILLFVGGITFCLLWSSRQKEEVVVEDNLLHFGKQGANLVLGDGKIIRITSDNVFDMREIDGTFIRKDSVGINYTQDDSSEDTLIYNELRTLTGMEYGLTLSDGTCVFLNAETSLKYPVAFKNKQRVVELSGEAYFKVAKDSNRPFIVNMHGVEVVVLGTSFNIRAYIDEPDVTTTLVEGNIVINGRRLVPGEQANYTVETGELVIKNVDTDLYTAWKEGYFVFKNESLGSVMKRLAHWYGIRYCFEDENAKNVRIGARFDKYKDMTPIIEMLQSTKLVNIYMKNDSLFISERK